MLKQRNGDRGGGTARRWASRQKSKFSHSVSNSALTYPSGDIKRFTQHAFMQFSKVIFSGSAYKHQGLSLCTFATESLIHPLIYMLKTDYRKKNVVNKNKILALDCDAWSGWKADVIAVFHRLNVFSNTEKFPGPMFWCCKNSKNAERKNNNRK